MKRLFYIFSSLFCFFALCNKAYSQQWISIDGASQGKAVTMTVLESNQYFYIVKVSIHGLYDNLINRGNRNFHFLSIEKIGRLNIVGEPDLPIINQPIAIPPGSTMSATIEESKWTDIEIDTIYPAQKSANSPEQLNDFSINERVYGEAFLPAIITKGKETSWRGIRRKSISVCPFRYYPQENRLSVLNEFVIRIEFIPNSSYKEIVLNEQPDPLALFDNKVYKEVSQEQSVLSRSDNYNYLIVIGSGISTTNTLFLAKLKQFRLWKALKGFKSQVVCSSNINDLRAYIDQEKINGVKYVLFIGDVGNIPTATVSCQDGTGYINSDYWYGCPNNSHYADVPVGRFSISCVDDFVHMVDKTIRYESEYDATNSALLVAHKEGAPDNDSYQGCCQYIKSTYHDNMSFATAYGASTYYLYQGDNATNQDVIDQINLGTHIINYRGHGANTYWGNPEWNYSSESFCDSLIGDMDSNICAVFFSVACWTGNITSTQNCMLETFTRSDHGAVAFIGATRNTDMYTNNDFNKYLFNKLISGHVYHIGDINIGAHNSIMDLYNNGSYQLEAQQNAIDNAYSYICGGDPALELWTAAPQSIGNVDFSCNNGIITISTGLSDGYYISVVTNDGAQVNTIQTTGSTCTFAKPTGNFYVAINKHNYFPYIIYYDTESDYIQNVTFNYDAYYNHSPLDIGFSVTAAVNSGNVIVKSGKKLIVKKGSGDVYIDSGFKCEKGAAFEIK